MSDDDSLRRAADLTGLVVEDELGRGAFTTVHRVRRGDQTFALKRPNADSAGDPGLLAAFQREAALLACVDDPGVPRIHAAGRYDGAPALVLEYIPGGSLADQLAHGPLAPARVVEIAGQVGRGLAAAHRVGLVHRDVKPGNIMMSPGRPAKLIDFGLALLGAGPADDDRAVGTFLYSSPEQSGLLKRPVDGRSDLYSLGVVLFECLTGRLPFEASDVGELLRLHLTAPVPDLAELSPGIDPVLAAAVARLLAKDPDDRYPDAGALLAALRAAPGGDAAAEPAAGSWPLRGRDAEREALADRWRRARTGRGGVAVLRGPAGSGRTRLAEEAAALVTDVPVLRATGEEDSALPLAALRAAIDGHLQAITLLDGVVRVGSEQHVRDAVAVAGPALVARLSSRLGELIGETGGAEARDDHLFSAVATFLAELAKAHGGLLLLGDDAQWLDPGSREVLGRLVPDLPRLPLLVLLTERDGAGVPNAVEADLELTCEPLDQAAVEGLIASRLPGAAVPAELTGHVAGRTDGSPLAVVAYLLRLLDAGLLTPLWGAWHFDAAGADALPAAEDVRTLLASRLGTLTPDDREFLVTAAVVGPRFRTETLVAAGGSSEDRVVAAVGAAVERRVVEARPGGWFVFLHPLLRESLLDGVSEQRLRRLHASIAEALEGLPEPLRDADHVYAVARHHRRAGDAVPGATRRRSALAAGLRALDDTAPAEAVGYLEDALDGDPAPTTAVLHPLAQAYLRAARFAEAGATIERALATEQERRSRAHLLITEIELHHTLWDDEKALVATAAALTELGRPLPRNGLGVIASTVGIGLAGAAVRRTGWGLGNARGRRRDDLAALAATLDAGGYAAGVGLRLREAGVLAMRAMYAVNRIGPCPEYVRVYALVGYVAAAVKLRGTAERCLNRAASVAHELGDPGLVAYVEWMRGCAWLFGGIDDGSTWEESITRDARWFGPAQLIPGFATIGIRLLLRGYTTESQAEYERGLRRLTDVSRMHGTSFGMLSVMIPAMQGRPGEAAAALADLRAALPPGTGTTVQRANMLVAAACAMIEQGEFGEPFEAIVAEFRGLGLRLRDMMTQHKWFYAFQSHGRMAQLRLATEEQRPARIAAARAAVADLRRVRKSSPLLDAAYLIGEAALAQLLGEPRKAIEWSDKAEHVARTADAPLVHFEVARFRARAFRALGLVNESDRQARIALSLAGVHGWESRRRQARTEFGAEEGAATNRRTVVERRSDAPRNRRLEALQQVGAAAATVLDPQELARVALDEMLRILGAERALFFLLDEAGEPVQFAGRGADGGDLVSTTAYGATLVRRVAFSGEALVVTGTEQGAALGSRSAVVHGLRSIMVAPVQFKGNTLGVVYLDSRMARGIFTDDDVEVLVGVTSHVAVSLETARAAQLHLAVRAAQQQQAFAEMLRASLAELSGIHDPARLLSCLFEMLVAQLNASAGCLLSADGSMVVEVIGKASPSVLGDSFPVALPSVLGPSVISADAALSEIYGNKLLIVPLDHRDGRSGVVVLGADSFDDSAVQVASSLATQGMSAYLNACLFSRVQELATTDELTEQHNRRHFYAIATALVSSAARGSRDLAAVMLDIDKFKSVNDTYGHGVGDEVIREVAARVRASIRHSDVLGRYGGEEFALVLPDHDGSAVELAERMRSAVADTPISTAAGPLHVTISVGLTQLDPADATLDQTLARADHALYRAKESGRNRVVVC
ncbi:diguanylate cyclase [Paractinoplanes globisporus]|uniref:Diguanylate cyclase n=1 Tax=Paractinoplanes globisporus TaxID=113565 RepID=A0ABW6WWF3_9ACTN|nr:diguanylate cyclase [Actinoplanes globisporus]